jgi:hypothetical protein
MHGNRSRLKSNAFGELAADFEQLTIDLIHHGHGRLCMSCTTGNGGIREVVVDAGRSFRFRVANDAFVCRSPVSVCPRGSHREWLAAPVPVLIQFVEALETALIEIVRHGYGEVAIRCEVGRNGSRQIMLQTAKSERFVVPTDDLIA